MSIRRFPTRDGASTVAVGWDPARAEFYYRVFPNQGIASEVGANALLWDSAESIDAIVHAVAPYAEIDAGVIDALGAESGQAVSACDALPTGFIRPERVVFADIECVVVQTTYPSGGIAFELYDDTKTDLLATATAGPAQARLKPNEALIRNSGETEGVLGALIAAGIARPTFRKMPRGFGGFALCTVVEPATKESL